MGTRGEKEGWPEAEGRGNAWTRAFPVAFPGRNRRGTGSRRAGRSASLNDVRERGWLSQRAWQLALGCLGPGPGPAAPEPPGGVGWVVERVRKARCRRLSAPSRRELAQGGRSRPRPQAPRQSIEATGNKDRGQGTAGRRQAWPRRPRRCAE